MIKVEFKKRTEQIEIAGKVYEICVSNYEFIKKAQESLSELAEAQKALNEGKGVDQVVDALKVFVDFTLDDDFDRIWEASGNDIFNLLDVANAIASILKKGFEYKAKKYV